MYDKTAMADMRATVKAAVQAVAEGDNEEMSRAIIELDDTLERLTGPQPLGTVTTPPPPSMTTRHVEKIADALHLPSWYVCEHFDHALSKLLAKTRG